MAIKPIVENHFIKKLTTVTEDHLSDSNFGVNELATEMGMSRTTLHRQLKKHTDTPVSIFIREIRLKKAYVLLENKNDRVAEVAYKVGFGSTTYFIKCFKKFYGFPPGNVLKGKHSPNKNKVLTDFTNRDTGNPAKRKQQHRIIFFVLISIALMTLFGTWYFTKQIKNHEKSIAVLPFKNLSSLEENQYFADGVTQSILNLLNQIGNFSVVSKISGEQFRETTKSAIEIAEILDVNYLLQGSIQQQGERIRVMVQLVDAIRDKQIMSLQFDKQMTDIFEIQSNIARQVAGELQMTLSPREIEIIEKTPTENIEAYNLYLKGRYFWNTRTKFGIQQSIELFNKARDLDPDFALAYAGLADAYHILSGWGWYMPKEGGEEIAKRYAIQALEIDNNIAEAHTTLGFILSYVEWKWDEAEAELQEAIRLNPNYAFAHQIYSQLSDIKGDYQKAREEIEIALELDPLSPILHYISATLYYNEKDFENSLKECRELYSLENDIQSINWWFFKNYYRLGEGTKALNELQIILETDTLTENYTEEAAVVFSQNGLEALIPWIINIIEEIQRNNPDQKIKQYWNGYMSELYALSGNTDKALDKLEHYLETNTRGDRLVRLINYLDYENIREEQRFIEVVRKLGLMEYYNNTVVPFNNSDK